MLNLEEDWLHLVLKMIRKVRNKNIRRDYTEITIIK